MLASTSKNRLGFKSQNSFKLKLLILAGLQQVLRQAMPEKPIISITPPHPENYLKKGSAYVDPNCRYYSGKQFIDFGSIQWKYVMKEYDILDQRKVLVFFDDHQNELKR